MGQFEVKNGSCALLDGVCFVEEGVVLSSFYRFSREVSRRVKRSPGKSKEGTTEHRLFWKADFMPELTKYHFSENPSHEMGGNRKSRWGKGGEEVGKQRELRGTFLKLAISAFEQDAPEGRSRQEF